MSFKLKTPQMASPYSPTNLNKSSVHLPLLISFWAEIESLTTNLRHNPQKDREPPSGHKRPCTATKGATRHKRRLGSNDPRVTNSRTFTSTNLRGESKPMHKSNGKSTRLKSFPLESHHKQLMLMWGEERKNNEHNKWNFKK